MSVLRYAVRGRVQYYPVHIASELQYKRMRMGQWPPEGASPLHPVDRALGQAVLRLQPETLLCVANHERKPLIAFDSIKEALEKYENEEQVSLNAMLRKGVQEPDMRYEMRRLEVLEDNYAMQRMKTGRHSSHTIMRARPRNKK
ncbi:hypothetical protein BBBOND_0310090 [Babesia bigemina]|uniref:Uncharacterized protein n=1 Tax=Babesia bigemina TaxID=5866 RepID=A0A061D8R5_BABBI|nr:hypothetical protein BBBOND_0310090 [Babesia bigemina]CDR97106.1 hypothetical protein BBBOND_0310090 [Babesia bigemina]|eukprot:XP_012769292.1 hypothetical protein BBBOND_0310090 [Babesia bigemina]